MFEYPTLLKIKVIEYVKIYRLQNGLKCIIIDIDKKDPLQGELNPPLLLSSRSCLASLGSSLRVSVLPVNYPSGSSLLIHRGWDLFAV